MKENNTETAGKTVRGIKKIVREKLKGFDIELTDFIFESGGNVYVFTYSRNGSRKHTFIDTGDKRYREQMLSILKDNDIRVDAIENILITHRHFDHCGLLDLLAGRSKANILVHEGFKGFVEGKMSKRERVWMRNFDPTKFKGYNIQYLPRKYGEASREIGGISFPRLGEPIILGEGVMLEILACPDSHIKHSPDQLIVLYSPSGQLREEINDDFRPSDDIVFSGDLWLMRGPVYDTPLFQRINRTVRYKYYQMKSRMSGDSLPRMNIREEDAAAKEALKTGFNLVRVKPGHGEEFIGSKIIPENILAKRDMLVKLGFPIDADKSIIKSKEYAAMVSELKEEGYGGFIDELNTWESYGYNPEEISDFILRIYKEQEGGRGAIKNDRKERRKFIKEILIRIESDMNIAEELRLIAKSVLPRI